MTAANPLGEFLRGRRERLDPAAFGLPPTRRRTPGLRREEVANRAHVSPTWYTWLEQGRGGAPSADVLDRLARALMLSEVERQHLFLIALGRPPEVRYQPPEGVSPHLQRVLDALEFSPAYIRTSIWDIVAWNRATEAVLMNYRAIPSGERNLLRLFFLDPRWPRAQANRESVASYVVAAFRADLARAGAANAAQALIEELLRLSPEFAAIWRENDVRAACGEVSKRITHPRAGEIGLDYSTFMIEGRPDLDLVVFTASTPQDAAVIRGLMRTEAGGTARRPL